MKIFNSSLYFVATVFSLGIIVFFDFLPSALSQPKNVPDSLFTALDVAQNDSSKAMTYLAIGRFYQKQIQYDSAFNSFNKALENAIKLKTEKTQALVQYYMSRLLLEWEKYEEAIMHGQLAEIAATKAQDSARYDDIYYQLGRAFWKIGNISSAFQNYKIALANAEALGNLYMQGVIINGLGTLYWRVADYNTALQYYYKSLDVRVERKDQQGEILVLINIGWILDEWGKHKEAITLYKKAKELILKIDYPLGEGYTYFSIGNSLKRQALYDSAIYYYKIGITTYGSASLGSGVRECQKELASTYKNQGRLNLAFQTYKDLLNSAIEIKNIHLHAEVLYGLALVEYERGHIVAAREYALQSLEKEQYDKSLIIKNRELLSEILEKTGNFHDAIIQQKIVRTLSDSIFNEKKRMQFSLMDAQFKSEKIVGENELLKKDLDLKDVRIKQRGVAIIASIACAIFLVVFVFMLYNGNKNKAELNQKLSKRNYEIENQRLKIEGQNSELTLLNETKDQLLATIGHDIKGPLTSIHAMLRFVNDELISLEEQKEMFGNLEIQVDNVTQMVGNLLDWSKSQLGGFKAFPAEVSVATLVEKQQLLFIPKLKAKKITLEQQLNNCSGAFADLEQLRIVVRNLISNAIKFTEQGGQIVVSCLSENTEVGISIADNGVGMSDEEVIQLLQNKSTSINKPGTDNEKGSGLGLMLSRSLIEDNGGKLEIHSELGKGSVFTVWIPKATKA